MSTTTSALRPRARLLVALVATLSILAAQFAVFSTGTAFAGDPCDEGGSASPSTLQRLVLEFDDGTFLDTDVDPWCDDGGQDMRFLAFDAVAIHFSCSEVLTETQPYLAEYGKTITGYWVNRTTGGDQTPAGCQPLDEFPITVPPPSFVDPDCETEAAVLAEDGDGYEYTVTGTIAPGESVTVTATATGAQPLIGQTVWNHDFPSIDDLNCDPQDPEPDASVSLVEQCEPTGVAYTVSNDGDGTVYWQLIDNSDSGAVLASGSIDEGATGVDDVQPYNDGDAYDLTLNVYSDSDLTDLLDTTTLTGIIDCPPPFEAAPAIELVKTAVAIAGDEVVPGELVDFNGGKVYLITPEIAGDVHTITYVFDITNTGNVTLFNVTLDDPMLGGEITIEDTTLAPGASTTGTATYDLTDEDIATGTVPNTATVTGWDEEETEVSDTDDETFDIVQVFDVEPLEPSISVVKDAVDGVSDDGEGNLLVTITGQDGTATVTYRYVVTNTGDDDLTDLTLIDDKIGDLSDELVAAVTAEFGGPVLPVDGQVTITATHEVSAADFDALTLTNLVDVTGLGVDSGATVTDDDTETVVLIQVLDAAEEAETEASSDELPRTGLDTAGLTGLGLLLAALGAASLLFTRRRTENA